MSDAEVAERPFRARLIDAMAEMSNPTKSATAKTPKYSYRYETLDQVLGIVRPALLRHGIGLTQRQRWDAETGSYLLLTIVFDETEEAELDRRPVPQFGDAQACGSWETYMRRYALRTAFGLAGEDDDGAATVGAERVASRPRPHPDRRKRMLAKVAQLKARCIEHGVSERGMDEWAVASLGTSDTSQMDDSQVERLGTYLAQIAQDAS